MTRNAPTGGIEAEGAIDRPVAWIVLVNWNSRDDLQECLTTLRCQTRPAAQVLVVDNASSDGSVAMVRHEFPEVRVLPQRSNLGFAAANNVALRLAAEHGVDYVALLNPDTTVAPNWLEELVAAAESDARIAVCQAKILLYDAPDRLNTDGNVVHYLGFGYCGNYGMQDTDSTRCARDIGFASGAAMLIRVSACARIGVLDETIGFYSEDLEYSLRARLAGLRVVIAPSARVWHKYRFLGRTGKRKFYFLERNRWIILLSHYRARTLLILSPALLALEVGLLVFAWRDGWLRSKLAAYRDVWRARGRVRALRERVQALRRLDDRRLLAAMCGTLVVPDVRSALLDQIGNPVLNWYFRVVQGRV